MIIKSFKKSIGQNVADKPNLFMGYRSFNALKNDDIWIFAQQMFLKNSEQVNKKEITIGVLWLVFDIVTWIIPLSLIIQAIIFFIGMLYLIIKTEICIKVKSNLK
ncbi:SdpI family protein [Staphylococcus sp. ACRSN]|uniref:SdpI family protein n=1 Tax=Staphylococcus sp. ACRSN TaxID=2918214 RepID=UPI001EF23515|nr:SdpI family protein [Staphylococcus sp. ACRSN]MCG7339513.1 SdpI family protein [Staphylococcus sp. ACRSN]